MGNQSLNGIEICGLAQGNPSDSSKFCAHWLLTRSHCQRYPHTLSNAATHAHITGLCFPPCERSEASLFDSHQRDEEQGYNP
jgi:hypothetical protein